MINNFEKSTEYAQKLFKIENKIINNIEKESIENNIPIITREVLNYLIYEANRCEAKNILEIGTATGYSGLFLSSISKKNKGFFTTIEIDENRYKKAVTNFKKLNLYEHSELIQGDALEYLPKIIKNTKQTGIKYDFIFIDASKGQYNKFFNYAYELLSDNGTIFIDNLMFRGMVALDETEFPKKYRSLLKKLKQFIQFLNENHNFILLPFGDGVGIVRK